MSIFFYQRLNNLFLQFIKFTGVSGFGWLLDFSTYSLLGIISSNYFLNNFISCLIGASFVFIVSPHLVFKNQGKIPNIIKYLIYIIYQFLLICLLSYLIVIINDFMINLMSQYLSSIITFSYICSKIIVTPFALICNFTVLKIIFEKIF